MSESSKYYGSWKMIGYQMKTTNNVFTYTEEADLSSSNETAELDAATAVWSATPVANLNDCAADTKSWQLSISKGGSGNNGAAYDADVEGGPGGDCDVLVPGFGKLDQSGVVGSI